MHDLQPKIKSRRQFGRWSAALLCSLLALTGCEPSTPLQVPTSKRIPTVNVIRLKRVASSNLVSEYFGKIVPSRERQLGFGKPGTVRTMRAIGSRVKSGELLCELDQPQLEDRRADLKKSLQDLDGQPENVVAQQRASLELELQEINGQMASGIHKAPYDCVVADTFVDAGSVVGPRAPVMRIIEFANPDIRVNFPRYIASRIGIGDAIKVVVNDFTLDCEVKRKSIEEDPVGSKTLWLKINSPLSDLPWSFGQTVVVRFSIPTENQGCWVPSSSLVREGSGLWSVFVLAAEAAEAGTSEQPFRVERKLVDLVQLEDKRVLIDGRLSDGEMMIANGSHRVVPGQQVEPHEIVNSIQVADAQENPE